MAYCETCVSALPDLLADVGKVHHLVLAPDGALQEDPHLGRVGVGEADGRERDRRLDDPAVLGDARLALVDALPVPVRQRHGLVGDQRVALGPEGVDLEDVGVALVVVGVEADADVVVLVDPALTVQDAPPDSLGVRVVEDDREVEVVVVEGDAELGALGCGRAVDRDALAEVGDRLDPLPEGLVEGGVDGRGTVGADGADGLAGRILAVRGGGLTGGEARQGDEEGCSPPELRRAVPWTPRRSFNSGVVSLGCGFGLFHDLDLHLRLRPRRPCRKRLRYCSSTGRRCSRTPPGNPGRPIRPTRRTRSSSRTSRPTCRRTCGSAPAAAT